MDKETDKEYEVGERLDKAVAAAHPEYSRAAIEKLIEAGAITVNGENVKSKYIVKPNDDIQTDFSELEKAPEAIELPIIYEDENVIVINKPIGILAHTKGAFSKEGTVASWLKGYVQHTQAVIPDPDRESRANTTEIPSQAEDDKTGNDFWNSNRAGIVHRLDRATSGVMICAKNEAAQTHLQKQFAKRNVKKVYKAVVMGELDEAEGLIDIPIERNPKKPATFRAGANGKSAQTQFVVLKTNGKYSLLELRPHTGRTHQLRVHMQYLNHPIVGDGLYGGETSARLLLHAYSLEVTLPGGEREIFTAPLPKAFDELLK